jgi:hypothetical protein
MALMIVCEKRHFHTRFKTTRWAGNFNEVDQNFCCLNLVGRSMILIP